MILQVVMKAQKPPIVHNFSKIISKLFIFQANLIKF